MPCKHMTDSDATGVNGRDNASLCGACQTGLFASRFELKETHIAARVPETEATLEATSVARKFNLPSCMCRRQLALLVVSLILTTYHFMNKVSAGL